ncbi:MAG TPA: hypothetical protein VGM19_13005 [Armatimonadota bacterium]|jgi:plasmid stability protein
MPNVLIRDLPADMVERLKALAAHRGRSMQQELRRIIARETGYSLLETYEAAQRISEEFRAEGRTFSDSTELVREDRDSR